MTHTTSERWWLTTIRLALWLGIAHGFVEAFEFIALGMIPGALSWRNGNAPPVLWVAPLFYGLVFPVIAIVLAAIARAFRLRYQVVVIAGLVATSVFLLASLQGRVFSWVASTLLALGAASVAVRIYRERADVLHRLVVRTLPILVVMVVVAAVGTSSLMYLREHRQLQRLPTISPDRPNVVMLIIDTQRADYLSSYGYSRPTTPHIDSIATEGVLFERASATSSWTLPSHATIMTGRLLHEHRAGNMGRPYLDDRFPTLAEVLQAEGYATGGFVANGFWCGRQTRLNRGFIHYEDFYGNLGDAVVRTVLGRRVAYEVLPRFGFYKLPGRKWSEDINQSLVEWIDALDGRPFFAFVNYFDVHGPLTPPAPFAGRFSDGTAVRHADGTIDIGALTVDMELPSPDIISAMIDRYDESLAYLDHQIGLLIKSLERRGLLENTLLIITSDHGESWGEHGLLYHGHSLYLEQEHVPLIMRLPKRLPAGSRRTYPVGLDRLATTIVELVGVDHHPFPGVSLLDSAGPAIAEAAQRSIVPSFWPTSRGSVASLTTRQWHFIMEQSGSVELYDITVDPREERDLAAEPIHRNRVIAMRAHLDSILTGSGLPWD